ncbi:hypothetical protein GCM10010169_21120 [Micromonospora fulviviridis]|uniref:phage tail protein n=1 Tax=Micromonospora fulviviridis TaxID=47860 RepID=UPI0016665A2C|nr:phage tail protein [Micromonospora fulviviridis]GGR76727.1 hypothetical protein GCM10010169_21120 [Micromonospora fulviviridis]
MTEPALHRLLDLVPVHLLARDAQADGGTGPLTALLAAVAGELELLEADLDRLHDGFFVETCAEWLVPYLADLVGLAELPPDLGVTVSRRALVANTVAYRRRKGTVAVLEQVARDVTGWPARAVEHHPLLVGTTHVNHVRPDRPATVSLRGAARIEAAAVVSPPGPRGALDPLTHTAEVRRIPTRRGRYGIDHVAVHLFPTQAYELGAPEADPPAGPNGGWSAARAVADHWTFDPLGRAVPLYAPPRREEAVERLATEVDLPVPLRPRRLLDLLGQARAGTLAATALPLGVRLRVGGVDQPDLTPDRIRVCHLEDLAPDPAPQVMVDPVAGRLRVHAPAAPDAVFVRYAYGGLADVGAGTYDRTAAHEALLATDPGAPVTADGPDAPPAAGQTQVCSGTPAPVGSVPTLAAGLAAAEASWAAPGSTTRGGTYVVSVADSASYPGDVAVTVPAGTRLVLVAAGWPTRRRPDGEVLAPVPGRYAPDGLRPHLRGSLRITGEPGSSVVVDGLLVEGDVVVAAGQLGHLTVAHGTVTGAVRVESAAGRPNSRLQLRLSRVVAGAVTLAATVPMATVDTSVLDATAGGGTALAGEGVHACLEGSTVRGAVRVRSLDASSCVLDGPVEVAHRQVGCLRFSYVAPGSRTPRRYRCVPADGEPGPLPVYAATDPASPAYPALAGSCPVVIREGGEDRAEPGVHHHLRRPLRLRAAQRQLDPYRPVGIELGIFGS